MGGTTALPTWAVYAVSIGAPVAAFLGTLLGHAVSRRGARELERRSRREEVMRNLRWAVELALDADPRRAGLGVSQLTALLWSDLLDRSAELFVDAALADLVRHRDRETGDLGFEDEGG